GARVLRAGVDRGRQAVLLLPGLHLDDQLGIRDSPYEAGRELQQLGQRQVRQGADDHARLVGDELDAAGEQGVLPRAEGPVQLGGPAGVRRRLIAAAEGRPGGEAHRAVALEAQLQVA
ncbi:MAG: hypothetical protein ACK559_35320, partial [bacterium]